jgi:predicted nucleic acid-binding protein
MKLVDTSSWVEYLRNLDSPAANRVEELVLRDEAALCDMTAVELWNGARGEREKRELGELEKVITLLPINEDVWLQARKLARLCRSAGLTVPATDIVIAACAAHHEVSLEYCDRHFDQIMPLTEKL